MAPWNDRTAVDEGRRMRSFARQILRAFSATDKFAIERLGVRPRHLRRSISQLSDLRLRGHSSSERLRVEGARALLARVHASCIAESVEKLCSLLGAPLSAENRVDIALGDASKPVMPYTPTPFAPSDTGAINNDAQQLAIAPVGKSYVEASDLCDIIDEIVQNFNDITRALVRDGSTRVWLSDYSPDWRTRNMIWDLLKSLGRVAPPAQVEAPFMRLKQAAFASMFPGDYLTEQRNRARFRDTLLRHIPRPGAWDAHLSWAGVAFFISVPLASIVHSFEDGNRLRAFYGIFFSFFSCSAVGCCLFYARYTSWYATMLLDKAAVGLSENARLSFGLDSTASNGDSQSSDMLESLPADDTDASAGQWLASEAEPGGKVSETQPGDAVVDFDLSLEAPVSTTPPAGAVSKSVSIGPTSVRHHSIEAFTAEDSVTQNASGRRRSSESSFGMLSMQDLNRKRTVGYRDVEDGSALLRLFQVSMLVERMSSSTYFSEAWATGLSEAQLYTAIERILSNDLVLGRQFAAFSFTAVAISSKGTSLGKQTEETVAGEQFSFALFGLLSAAGFLSGLTSSVLADLIHRQISMTQTKEDGTAHEFAAEFGYYMRVIGGLNGFAGMFLATAVFHFLISIFRVSVAAVLPVAIVWLLGSAVIFESFQASFSYWTLTEVFDDLGEIVDRPDMLSPSPVTGSLQRAGRFLVSASNRLIPKRE